MYVCIWVVIVVFVLGGGGGGGGVFSHLSIKLFCTATEITFIYLFIFESCASSRSASKRMNKLTICRTMLRVHHIFFLSLGVCAIINSLVVFVFGVFCVTVAFMYYYTLHCCLCVCSCVCLCFYAFHFVVAFASTLSLHKRRQRLSLSLTVIPRAFYSICYGQCTLTILVIISR